MAVVRDALSSLEPKPIAVINTGIAFGLKPAKQDFGDVLVSEQIRLYELERRGRVNIARGDRPSSSDILLGWCRDFKSDWASNTTEDLRPRVHFGLFMSGEKLSDDPDFVAGLLSAEPEAIGGDMEAAGVYAAAQGHALQRIHWIIVKSICDWGMGKGDAHQQVAARNAIDFVFHVVGQPVVVAALRDFRVNRSQV
jgi:nucleoside phosphorylase